MTTQVRFPVDNYPAILEELDWEDFGIAFKLAGPWTPGESTVLVGFHSMWLAPYGGRYRNAAVTIDQRRHAAHLWVDRFAVPCSADEQVHHLLWVVSKLDEVIPVLHACFRGATMAQKYGGLVDDGINLVTNIFLVIPTLPLLIVISSFLDQTGPWIMAAIIGFTSWAIETRSLGRSTTEGMPAAAQ